MILRLDPASETAYQCSPASLTTLCMDKSCRDWILHPRTNIKRNNTTSWNKSLVRLAGHRNPPVAGQWNSCSRVSSTLVGSGMDLCAKRIVSSDLLLPLDHINPSTRCAAYWPVEYVLPTRKQGHGFSSQAVQASSESASIREAMKCKLKKRVLQGAKETKMNE